MHRAQVGGLVAMICLLAACTSGGGNEARRPPVNVSDEVAAVDRQLIMGTWQCRELNPYPGQPLATTAFTYNADGTFQSETRSQGQGPVGAMIVNGRGSWAVQGNQVVLSNVRTEARAADGNPAMNVLAGLGAAIANNLMTNQREGPSDVLRLTQGEMVTRVVGIEDAPVFACTR